MTAHLRRCHEHRGRRPKAARKESAGADREAAAESAKRADDGRNELWRGLQPGPPAGSFEVDHPGDYATFNSNQLLDGTMALALSL